MSWILVLKEERDVEGLKDLPKSFKSPDHYSLSAPISYPLALLTLFLPVYILYSISFFFLFSQL